MPRIHHASTDPLLTSVLVSFETGNEDKDEDTWLEVWINKSGEKEVAYQDAKDDGFPDATLFQMYLHLQTNPMRWSEIPGAWLQIRIHPNGDDTWRFGVSAVLKFDNGATFTLDRTEHELSQDVTQVNIPLQLPHLTRGKGLDRDATLRDVISTLGDADRYVSSAYGVMHRTSKERGPVVLRLGVTGIGRMPNYRLESATTGEPILALDGATHEPWRGDADFTGSDNWSSATMTTDEVRELLGELRNFRRA